MATWTIDGPRQLDLDGPVDRLHARLVSARISVVGTDGPPRIEVTRVSSRPLIVEHENGLLRLRHEHPPRWPGLAWWLGQLGRRYFVEVSVAVPHRTPADLHVVSGSVVASGLRAGATVELTSGRVSMLGLDGRVVAKVTSGTIEAVGVAGDLAMETVSGEITLADSAAGRVRARAISGALTFDLDNPHGSDIRLETTSGEITVRVREDSDLDVRLQATSGRVSTGFAQLPPFGSHHGRSAQGRLGAGTGRLYANAVSGNIALLPRPVDAEDPA